jgi:hypothetical protein
MKKVALVLSMVLVMAGWSRAGSDIEVVKNGTLYGYETTTIGHALAASFYAWEWLEYADKRAGES